MLEPAPKFERILDQPANAASLKMYLELIKKLEICGGVITGYHGTAASLARKIEQEGLEDQVCVEGKTGIWFWDKDVEENAAYNATSKAEELGENEGAIIIAQLVSPQPDTNGRKQWLANASNITILGIEYLDSK